MTQQSIMIPFPMRLPPEMYERLKALATVTDVPMQRLIRQAVTGFLDTHPLAKTVPALANKQTTAAKNARKGLKEKPIRLPRATPRGSAKAPGAEPPKVEAHPGTGASQRPTPTAKARRRVAQPSFR